MIKSISRNLIHINKLKNAQAYINAECPIPVPKEFKLYLTKEAKAKKITEKLLAEMIISKSDNFNNIIDKTEEFRAKQIISITKAKTADRKKKLVDDYITDLEKLISTLI